MPFEDGGVYEKSYNREPENGYIPEFVGKIIQKREIIGRMRQFCMENRTTAGLEADIFRNLYEKSYKSARLSVGCGNFVWKIVQL